MGDDADDEAEELMIDGDEPSSVAPIQRTQPEFDFDDITPVAPLSAAVASALETVAASPAAPVEVAVPVQKTPADAAAGVIDEVQANASSSDISQAVEKPSDDVAPAVIVQDEAVEPVIVPSPEPVEPEPVTDVVVDAVDTASDERGNEAVNTLPGETSYVSANVSAEVEPASTAAASIDEEAGAAMNSQLPVEELPRTAGLFDDVPQPITPSPADAAANSAEQENGGQRA